MGSWFSARVWRHSSELFRLASPVVVSRAGFLMLVTLDVAMLGRVSENAVATYTLGTSPFIILMVIGMGLQQGVLVSTSHHRGAGRLDETGQVWRRGLPYALIVGLLGAVLLTQAELYFEFTRQDRSLIDPASSVSFWQGVGLAPMMICFATGFFLEGLGRPVPLMLTVWGGNILNLFLNLWLIHGGLGVPAMGADGAALATSIVRALMAVGLSAYVWYLADHHQLGVRRKPVPGWVAGGREDRRYGYAAGLSLGFETGAFGVLTIFAGWVGPQALAVYGIANALLAMLFMVALGLAIATGVRVGVAHGRGDGPDRALAGWVGLGWCILLLGVFGFMLQVFPEWIAAIYTSEPELMAAAVPTILIVGWLLFADGGQAVLGNALRAAADPWVPSAMAFFSYFVVMIPAGWYLGVHLDRGTVGLYEGILIASVVNVTILASRWAWRSIRGIRDMPEAAPADAG